VTPGLPFLSPGLCLVLSLHIPISCHQQVRHTAEPSPRGGGTKGPSMHLPSVLVSLLLHVPMSLWLSHLSVLVCLSSTTCLSHACT
jgi:hypothetical protein